MDSFEILVPAPWVMISLSQGIEEQVTALVSTRLETTPPSHRKALREALAGPLLRAADELARGGAVALVTSMEPIDGLVGSPIAVFMPLAVPMGQEPLDLLLAVAATDPTASTVDVGPYLGVRTTSTADVTDGVQGALKQAAALAHATLSGEAATLGAERRGVRYLVGEPGDPGHWIDVTFGVTRTSLPESAALAEFACSLFDQSMQTFRWVM